MNLKQSSIKIIVFFAFFILFGSPTKSIAAVVQYGGALEAVSESYITYPSPPPYKSWIGGFVTTGTTTFDTVVLYPAPSSPFATNCHQNTWDITISSNGNFIYPNVVARYTSPSVTPDSNGACTYTITTGTTTLIAGTNMFWDEFRNNVDRFYGSNYSGTSNYGINSDFTSFATSTSISQIAYKLCLGTCDTSFSTVPPDTNTRIENMQPNATTTATSTITLSADVYINPDDFSTSSMYVDFITQRYNRRDLLDSDPNYREFHFTNLVSGMNTLSTTTTFTKNEIISFSAELKKDIHFWFDQSLVYEFVNFTVVEGSAADLYYASTSNAATSYVANYSSSTAPTDCISASTITEKVVCKFGEITANVLQTVFTPSQESIDKLTGLKDILVTKPPVGYIYVVATSLTGATTTASSTFTLQANSTLMTNIFTPLRTALNAILWFVFAVFYFIRFKNMHI